VKRVKAIMNKVVVPKILDKMNGGGYWKPLSFTANTKAQFGNSSF
jgi:hypothetical protein